MTVVNSKAEQSEPVHLSAAGATTPEADTSTANNDFSAERVLVVAYDDPRVSTGSKSHCRVEQDFDDPTYLVIAPRATDDQLERAAKRFDLSFEDLAAFRDDVCTRALCSGGVNDDDADEQGEPFEPFSWLNRDAEFLPLSRFASSTRDLAQGLALALEILEGTSVTGVQLKGQPVFSAAQLGILSRFAVATANAIASEACEALDWLNEHGAAHVRKGALAFAGGGLATKTPELTKYNR